MLLGYVVTANIIVYDFNICRLARRFKSERTTSTDLCEQTPAFQMRRSEQKLQLYTHPKVIS